MTPAENAPAIVRTRAVATGHWRAFLAVAMAAGAAGRLFAGLARYALEPRVPQTGCGGG